MCVKIADAVMRLSLLMASTGRVLLTCSPFEMDAAMWLGRFLGSIVARQLVHMALGRRSYPNLSSDTSSGDTSWKMHAAYRTSHLRRCDDGRLFL